VWVVGQLLFAYYQERRRLVVVDRKELVSVLGKVKPGLANRELVEQSVHFVFKDGWVMTYNDMVSVRHPVPSLAGIRGAVPAQQFYSLLDRSEDEKVYMEVLGGGGNGEGKLVVTGNRFKAELQMLMDPVDRDADLGLADHLQWSPVVGEELRDAVKMCLYTVSRDLANATLACVHFKGSVVESCDNFRLSRYTLSNPVPGEFLVPGSSLRDLVDFTPKWVAESNGWLHFKDDSDVVFSCRLFEGEYPDTDWILDMEVEGELEFPPAMVNTLDRASVLAEVDLTGESYVDVIVRGKECVVKSSGEAGRFEEKVPLDHNTMQGTVEFQIEIGALKQILAHLRRAELAKDRSRLKFIGESYVYVISLPSED